jgi:c-di-GMP-binding flagellar brake protein YcgR
MTQDDETKRTPLNTVEEQEQYLIHSRTELMRVLSGLAKKPDILTAYFNRGREYLLTAVIAVLPERNLIVLDYGADEKTNQRALEKGHLVCVTKHNNISIKFTCEELKRARYQGETVFAAPIPESVFRLQRREFFRVSVPVASPIYCQIPRAGGEVLELPVVDISCGGLGLVAPAGSTVLEIREALSDCLIDLPEFGALTVNLEVRNMRPQRLRDGGEAQRIGCAFMGLTMDRNALIQRYIHKVQVDQKALSQQ